MNHMQRPAQGLQNWRRQLAPVSEKNMYRYNVPFYELCFNYIIYAKACARTADLVLVIGTSLRKKLCIDIMYNFMNYVSIIS